MTYQLDQHGEMLMAQYRERTAVYERLSHLADEGRTWLTRHYATPLMPST